MDLEKIKRFANSQFESWKIAKAVTEVKNEIKNAEQGRDIAMSDVFKTLREPLIEQQKKTDAKQDAVIDQLKANQLALTGGFKDLVESNRDVLTLQQELPFPGVESSCQGKISGTLQKTPKNSNKSSNSLSFFVQIHQNLFLSVNLRGNLFEFFGVSQKSFLDNYYVKISTRINLEK